MHLALIMFLCLPLLSDETEDLIAAFSNLPQGAVEDKLALLEKLGADPSSEAEEFLELVMEKSRETEVRVLAFQYWASGQRPEKVKQFLNSLVSSSVFEAFIPVIPKLEGFDTLAYLETLYERGKAKRFSRALNLAVASLDSDEALYFLKQRWNGCENFREALDLLPVILTMEKAQESVFLRSLMKSQYPFARYEGAARLLREDSMDSLQEVADFLGQETNPGVRSAVLAALPASRTEDAARVVIDASAGQPRERLYEIVDSLAQFPPDILRRAVPADWYLKWDPLSFQVTALAFSQQEELYEALEKDELDSLKKGLRHFQPDVSLVSAVCLSRLTKYNSAGLNGIKKHLAAGSADDRWEAMHTVQCFRLDDPYIVGLLLDATGKSNRALKIKAAEVLSSLSEMELIPRLRAYFNSNDALLHIAAIKSLGRLGGKESVLLLLDRLKREKGRAQNEAASALKEISGRNFGMDHALWTRWWENQGDTFIPPPDTKSLWFPENPDSDRYSFYGLYVDTHYIAYVLDVSGSMQGGRIAKLKQELKRSIESMTGEHTINLITFNDSVRKWRKELTPMGEEKNRKSALDFVAGLTASGGTNLFGGLTAGLKDDQAATVILLSDGEPTAGRVVNTRTILEKVMQMNREMQMQINTVAIGEADRDFMMRLASSSGGTFKSIR